MKKMYITSLIPVIFIWSITLFSCEKKEQEKTVSKQEVPEAVLKAFNQAYPQAVIREYSEEIEDGQTFYEISCTFEGRSIDAVYHPDGSVSAIEEVIPAETLPAAVQEAITKEIPQFSLKLAEKIDEDGQTSYEVKVLNTADHKIYELLFSETGKLFEKEVKKSNAESSEKEND